MSLENEVAELRLRVEKIERRRSQGEEIKHQVWNDMQEDIYRLCRENHEQLAAFRAETSLEFDKVYQRFEKVDRRLGRLEEDVSDMKSDISEIKAILLKKQ